MTKTVVIHPPVLIFDDPKTCYERKTPFYAAEKCAYLYEHGDLTNCQLFRKILNGNLLKCPQCKKHYDSQQVIKENERTRKRPRK